VERVLAEAARVVEVRAALNSIVDPCSSAMAHPIGLADMGIIDRVAVVGDRVAVDLLPTSAHCLFVGLLEEAIETRIAELPWVSDVDVHLAEGTHLWDEERMAPAARERLRRLRAARRATAP
jgi:metal-sulfur cluster biosynthetic enzyme